MAGSDADNSADFVVICALEVERAAVCQVFELGAGDRVMLRGRRYWRGWFPGNGGAAFCVVVAQLPAPANASAAARTSTILQDWRPQAVLLVGIAAATHESQQLGDVVVAQSVYYYELGKLTPGETLKQPEMLPSDFKFLHWAQTASPWPGDIRIPRPDPRTAGPQRSFGVIASGEKVVSDSRFRDAVVTTNRTIKALEMEGYGFSVAALNASQDTRYLVIRGLCDYANESKGDAWHEYASASAAAYARHLLADCPFAPVGAAEQQPAAVSRLHPDRPAGVPRDAADEVISASTDVADLIALAADIAADVAAAMAGRKASETLRVTLALPRYHLEQVLQIIALLPDRPEGWRQEGAWRFRYTDLIGTVQGRAVDLTSILESLASGKVADSLKDPVRLAREIWAGAVNLRDLLNHPAV
jgi:nucleoside phosphorylase